MDIPAYLKQPTTILGIASILGVVVSGVASIMTHDVNLSVGIGLIAAGIVHVVMPDNSGAPSSVEKLVTDAATAVAQKRLAAAMPQLLADTMAAVSSFQVAPAPAPVPLSAPTPAVAAPVPAPTTY